MRQSRRGWAGYLICAALLAGAAGCAVAYAASAVDPPADAPLPNTTAAAPAVAPPLSSTRAGGLGNTVSARPGQALTVSIPGVSNIPIVTATVHDDQLEPPADVHRVGIWADGAALNATRGTTLLTGHVNYLGQGNGAFHSLATLHAGQPVTTVTAAGATTNWTISRIEVDLKTDGINPAVFAGPTGPRRLALVTCGGPYNPATGSYADNIIVWATPTRQPAT